MEKIVVREEVWERRREQNTKTWCVVGDFNSIRSLGERRNAKFDANHRREMRRFNEFIENKELVDIPMVGRKYTWYKPNGLVNSRIDRILVFREWLDKWPDNRYYVLDSSVSDHCALVLKTKTMDWGPNTFRSLGIWQKDNTFKTFIRDRWGSYEVQGSRIFIFKEKLKMLKAYIKVWNIEVFGNVFQEGEEIQKRIQKLDTKDDESELDEVGREERKLLLTKLSRNSLSQEALLQEGSSQVLKHRDSNSKYFYSVIKWRSVRNGLREIKEEGQWVEEHGTVKEKVRDFFKERFRGEDS